MFSERTRRRLLFTGLLIVLALGATEVFARLAAPLLPPRLASQVISAEKRHERIRATVSTMLEDRSDALATFDPNLGWRPRENVDNGIDIINAQGLRSPRSYTPEPAPGTLRIAVFGDSFVYGSGVHGEESFPARLEEALGGAAGAVEVLNYGVPGYGPDQAYLRFAAEARLHGPHWALLGIATPSLGRILSVSGVLRDVTSGSVAKPRFDLADDQLVLLPCPIRRLEETRRYLEDPAAIRELGAHDYWYEPLIHENALFELSHAVRIGVALWSQAWRRYLDPERPLVGPPGHVRFNEDSTAFRILARLIQRFVDEARGAGMRPLIVLLPDADSVKRSLDGEVPTLEPVADLCTRQGLPCADATDAFAAQPASADRDAWFVDGFHYSVSGNEIVGRWLAGWLEARWLGSGMRDTIEDPAGEDRPG